MKQVIKGTFILFVITLVSGALLGFVNELTQEPIARYEADKKVAACNEVFYEENEDGELVAVTDLVFESYDYNEVDNLNALLKEKTTDKIRIDEIYSVYRGETLKEKFYGYVFGVTTGEGYNGDISFYVGITSDGRISGVSLLKIGETPGLGMNAETVLLPQFKDVMTGHFIVVKTGAMGEGEIDAISGATVTSEAITEGVNAACDCYVILKEGGDMQ